MTQIHHILNPVQVIQARYGKAMNESIVEREILEDALRRNERVRLHIMNLAHITSPDNDFFNALLDAAILCVEAEQLILEEYFERGTIPSGSIHLK